MVQLALGATSALFCAVLGLWPWCAANEPLHYWDRAPNTCPASVDLEVRGDSLVQVSHIWSSRSVAAVDDDTSSDDGDGDADPPGGNGDLITDDGVVLPQPGRVKVRAPPYLHIDWFTPTSINITAMARSVGASKKAVVKALPALLCLLVLVIFFVAIIAFLYDKRQSITLAGSDLPNAPVATESSECEYVMIFPLAGEKRSQLHVSGTRAMYIRWDDVVNGQELARQAFLDPNKLHLITEEELMEKFQEEMTHEEYSKAVCDILTEALAGDHFGLEVEAFASVDHDEAFLKLKLPANSEAIELYAMHFRYQVPLSDKAYEKLDMEVPRNIHGDEVRAYTAFIANNAELFMPFRSVDRIRLIAARLARFLDISALMKQQVIAEHFAVHEVETVNKLVDDWANPKLWYQFPDRGLEDRIRDYFGEEVAWLFVWQNYFMHQLLVPTAIGFLLFFRRWLLTIDSQRKLQILFGLFMSVWVTVYNRRYLRYESGSRQRWGMDKFLLSSIYVRDEYVPDRDSSNFTVSGVMLLGDMLAIGMVIVCMIGVRAVHSLREHMMELHSHWVWQQGAAVLIACQILVLDMVWRVVSQWLVDKENHRTPAQWNRAWVQKVFLVRFFNNLYPFLYIGFIKQFSYQGCPDTTAGCLDELQRYLFTYFVTRLMVHLASDMFLVFVARSQISREAGASPDSEHVDIHLQVQAKSQDYDAVMRVDDWTENVLTFLFLTCFNVVLPVIAVLALLTTMLEARCLAHRNCCFLRRPVPRGADGIGEWQQLLETVEFLAVLINVGFAVFTMRPMKDLPVAHKVVVFVFIEHLILFVKHLIKEKYPPLPHDVEDLEQQNEEIIRQVAAKFDFHKSVAPPLLKQLSTTSVDISPSSFGGRRASAKQMPSKLWGARK